MPAKWKEVSAYTGQPIEEDMPINAAGRGAVAGIGVGPDGEPGYNPRKKKKKETLIDGRSKEYKAHRARIEAKRAKRAEQKNKFINKVKESISEFNRESYLEENNMNVLKDIVVKKQAKPVKFKDGTMKVDLFTASAITQALDKVKPDTRKKMEDIINNGGKSQFLRLVNVVFK